MGNCLSKALLLLLSVLFLSKNSFAVPGDYDGDGFADLAVIDADEPEDKTTVFVRASSNGNTIPYVFFPFGNFVISGSYFGNGRTYPGIVSIPTNGTLLRWHIKNPSNQDVVLNYGLKGDVVPNQGDFDCDGITDFAVVRNGSANYWPGFRLWYVALSSSPGAVHEIVFGIAGDEVFTGDTDGDSCAEMIALRGNFTWFSKKPFSQNITQVQWGLPGDIPLLPRDMNGDGSPDYVISRTTGSSQVAYVRFNDTTAGTVAVGSSASVPLIGNFFGGNTLAWFERAQSRFGLNTPFNTTINVAFGNPRRGVLRPDGTEVTESEDGRVGTGGTVAPPPTGGAVSCSVNLALRDGAGRFKNNPENSKNTVKVMFPGSMTGQIAAVKAYVGSVLFDTLRLGGYEWGNRERYYGRKSLSSYPDNLLIVAEMRNGTNTCVLLPDPQRVYD